MHTGNSHCGRRAITSLFHRPQFAARPKSAKTLAKATAKRPQNLPISVTHTPAMLDIATMES